MSYEQLNIRFYLIKFASKSKAFSDDFLASHLLVWFRPNSTV